MSSIPVRASTSLRADIERAVELDEQFKKIRDELSALKEKIRREAGLNLSTGITEVILHGANGSQASVVFPRCSYQIDEDRVLELKSLLGDDFDRLIRTEHKAGGDYHTFVENLQGPVRGVLRSIVQPKPTTPRVSLGSWQTKAN